MQFIHRVKSTQMQVWPDLKRWHNYEPGIATTIQASGASLGLFSRSLGQQARVNTTGQVQASSLTSRLVV